jgi:hypothetical protein
MQADEDDIQRHENDPLDESHDVHDAPGEPRPESPIEHEFVPAVQELKLSLEFIKALKNASLDNGDLMAATLDRLRNPPEHVLQIDKNKLHSLRQFLGVQNASQQIYTHFRDTHNACFSEYPMLSYKQMKNKVAEWSGVELMVHDMCPNSCIAV